MRRRPFIEPGGDRPGSHGHDPERETPQRCNQGTEGTATEKIDEAASLVRGEPRTRRQRGQSGQIEQPVPDVHHDRRVHRHAAADTIDVCADGDLPRHEWSEQQRQSREVANIRIAKGDSHLRTAQEEHPAQAPQQNARDGEHRGPQQRSPEPAALGHRKSAQVGQQQDRRDDSYREHRGGGGGQHHPGDRPRRARSTRRGREVAEGGRWALGLSDSDDAIRRPAVPPAMVEAIDGSSSGSLKPGGLSPAPRGGISGGAQPRQPVADQ